MSDFLLVVKAQDDGQAAFLWGTDNLVERCSIANQILVQAIKEAAVNEYLHDPTTIKVYPANTKIIK